MPQYGTPGGAVDAPWPVCGAGVDGVAAANGGVLGARRSPLEEIRGNIRAAGLTAVERNGRFERTGGDGARG